MDYQKTVNYLFSRLPMYQRHGSVAYKKDIGNITKASKHLNNPHKNFKSIHIAGTNGKGSTAHMIASIMYEAGYKVGLYTSPHLKDFRERIKINGLMISKQNVISFVQKNKSIFEVMDISFFEFTVIMAFDYFANNQVDIAIIETGLGGRLDSTNIIKPELSIITNISLDHTNLLGNNLKKIAFEKGGIIKENVPVIIGEYQKETYDVFKDITNNMGTFLQLAKSYNYSSDLKGNYQSKNINLAVSSILELKNKGWKISKDNIKKGLLNTVKNTSIFGRWQILSNKPLIICDTAHNKVGISNVLSQLNQTQYTQLHFVFGAVIDKNLEDILTLLPKNAYYYFCKAKIQRAIPANELKKKAEDIGLNGVSFTSVDKAFKSAINNANKEDLVFVGGSTFVVAEVI